MVAITSATRAPTATRRSPPQRGPPPGTRMTDTRIIFSPHTADPAFLGDIAAAMAAAHCAVAQAVWAAQFQVLHAMIAAQLTFLDSVGRATLQRR